MPISQVDCIIKRAAARWKQLKQKRTNKAAIKRGTLLKRAFGENGANGVTGFGDVGDYALGGLGGAAAGSLLYNLLGNKENKSGMGQLAALMGGAGIGAGGMGMYKNRAGQNGASTPTGYLSGNNAPQSSLATAPPQGTSWSDVVSQGITTIGDLANKYLPTGNKPAGNTPTGGVVGGNGGISLRDIARRAKDLGVPKQLRRQVFSRFTGLPTGFGGSTYTGANPPFNGGSPMPPPINPKVASGFTPPSGQLALPAPKMSRMGQRMSNAARFLRK